MKKEYARISMFLSRSGGMVDAMDSKSIKGNLVRVQVPPSAPYRANHHFGLRTSDFLRFFF